MKKIAAGLTALMILAPSVASAKYMCEKRFAEVYGGSCPAGSVWDSSYNACIVTSG